MNDKILKLAIPNVISNITIPFVGIIDIALMGRMESSAYLGGVGFGAMLFTLLYAGFAFLRMGTTGLTAQAYGNSNYRELSNVLFRAIILAFILGIFLIALQFPIQNLFITNINGSKLALSLAAEYFRIRIWAAPATLSVFVFMGWFIGMQNAKIPMIITIIISLANIIFSTFFVVACDMGINGVALGTVIAQYLGLIVSLWFLLYSFKRNLLFFSWSNIFDVEGLKKFFVVNRDILIRSVLLTGSFFYFNAVSASFGDDVLALNSAMLQFLWFFAYFIDGFAYATEALVGRYKGENNLRSLKEVIRKSFFFTLKISLAFTVIYIFAGKHIFKLLTDSIELLNLIDNYIYWIWALPLVSFLAFLYDGIYIGATATKPMRNLMIFSIIIVFLPSLHILKFYFGNHGMWLAICIMLLTRGLALRLFLNKSIISKIIPITDNLY